MTIDNADLRPNLAIHHIELAIAVVAGVTRDPVVREQVLDLLLEGRSQYVGCVGDVYASFVDLLSDEDPEA